MCSAALPLLIVDMLANCCTDASESCSNPVGADQSLRLSWMLNLVFTLNMFLN